MPVLARLDAERIIRYIRIRRKQQSIKSRRRDHNELIESIRKLETQEAKLDNELTKVENRVSEMQDTMSGIKKFIEFVKQKQDELAHTLANLKNNFNGE